MRNFGHVYIRKKEKKYKKVPPKVFLWKGVLKIWNKSTEENLCLKPKPYFSKVALCNLPTLVFSFKFAAYFQYTTEGLLSMFL